VAVFSHTLSLLIKPDGNKQAKNEFDSTRRSSNLLEKSVEAIGAALRRVSSVAVATGSKLKNLASPISIPVDSSSVDDAGRSIDEVNDSLDENKRKTDEGTASWDDFSRALGVSDNRFSSLAKKLGPTATLVGGVTVAVGAMVAAYRLAPRAIEALTGAWAEQEQAIQRVNIALRFSRQFSEQEQKSLQSFAATLQSQSRFGDEEILRTAAFISQLSGAYGQQLREATQLAVDFASVTGRSLETAGTLLAKVLQNNTGELTEYGIVLDDTIPAIQRGAEAMRVMREQFGGAAAQDVRTLQGATQQLSNEFGDLDESVQRALSQITHTPAVIELVRASARKLKESIDSLGGETIESIAGLVDAFVSGEISRQDFRVGLQPFIDVQDLDLSREAVDKVKKVSEQIGKELEVGTEEYFKAIEAGGIAETEFQARLDLDVTRASDALTTFRREAEEDVVLEADVLLREDPNFQRILEGLQPTVLPVDLRTASDDDIRNAFSGAARQLENLRAERDALVDRGVDVPARLQVNLQDAERQAKQIEDAVEGFLLFRAKIRAEIPRADADRIQDLKDGILEFGKNLEKAGAAGQTLLPFFASLSAEFDALAEPRVVEINAEAHTERSRGAIADLFKVASTLAQTDVSLLDDADLEAPETLAAVLDTIYENATKAFEVMESPAQALQAFNSLQAALLAIEERFPELTGDVDALRDKLRDSLGEPIKAQVDIDALLGDVDFADQKLQEFTEAERRIPLFIELGEYDQAVLELETLETLAEEFPDNIEIQIRVRRAREAIKGLGEDSKGLEKAFNTLRFDPAELAFRTVLDSMVGETDRATQRMLKIIEDFVVKAVELLALTGLLALFGVPNPFSVAGGILLPGVVGGNSNKASGVGKAGDVDGAGVNVVAIPPPGPAAPPAPLSPLEITPAVQVAPVQVRLEQPAASPDAFLAQPASVNNYYLSLNETTSLFESTRRGAIQVSNARVASVRR
jgi:hypothetical protein